MLKNLTAAKIIDFAEQIRISDLRNGNCLNRGKISYGGLSWNVGMPHEFHVYFAVDLTSSRPFVELTHLISGNAVSYRIELVESPSNLGAGSIWYFLCPETKKRCRNLYRLGDRFLHRTAVPGSMYLGQARSKNQRALISSVRTLQKSRPFNRKYAKTHYAGKLTRRFKSWLRYASKSVGMDLSVYLSSC